MRTLKILTQSLMPSLHHPLGYEACFRTGKAKPTPQKSKDLFNARAQDGDFASQLVCPQHGMGVGALINSSDVISDSFLRYRKSSPN
jgi:hypothetical protein